MSLEVVFTSAASLVLLVLVFIFVGLPPRYAYARSDINGVSVLESMWVAVHSSAIHEHMGDVEEPSLVNLRKAGMFMIHLGDIHASRVVAPESETLLE